ncbi:hypothetical protein M1512_00010 [Patescibacteria group bacterium]|jgi:hypothetical protein|nr:hypothetical protein [Patescibacteria group bacterium]
MIGGKLMFGHQDDDTTLDEEVKVSQQSQLNGDQTTDNTQPTQDDTTVNEPVKTDSDDLISLKQQALSKLSPLVTHLDQSPEERFKTLLMMIQASDNQTLLKSAYEAANQIVDEKQRAQALLDIVNEINYFTHAQKDN